MSFCASRVSLLLLLRNGDVAVVLDPVVSHGLADTTKEAVAVIPATDLGLKLYSLLALARLLCLGGGRTVTALSFDGDSRLVSEMRFELVVDNVIASVIAVLHVTEDKAFFKAGGGVDVRTQPLFKAAILSCCFFLSNIAA